MTALHELTLAESARRLRSGQLSSVALTEHALERIATLNPQVHAFVLTTAERALQEAAQADSAFARGQDFGPLHGIPYALKDIFDVAGVPTSCCSQLMAGTTARQDSFVVQQLRAGGAVLLGKLTTHEFALGGPSFDLPYPPARNPWNPEHFSGGSSSGSAVAVAAGLTRIALGSDTSGSIRGPAFYSGTVGLKPTYGLVSRRGVYPLSYTLDHCGVLTWTVADAARVLQVIAGHDPLDPGSEPVSAANPSYIDYSAQIGLDLQGLRIGFPRHFWTVGRDTSAEVIAALDDAAQTLAKLGARVEEVTLPPFELFSACGRVIMTAEGYSIHEEGLRARGSEYGRYTYQRLVPGAGLTSADLMQALRLRAELARIVNGGVLRTHHALLNAVALAPAPRIDSFPLDWPPSMTMQTIPFTVTGNPALSVPAGFTAAGLPLGFQIVGRAFDEATVLRIGAAYQTAKGFPDRWPALAQSPTLA